MHSLPPCKTEPPLSSDKEELNHSSKAHLVTGIPSVDWIQIDENSGQRKPPRHTPDPLPKVRLSDPTMKKGKTPSIKAPPGFNPNDTEAMQHIDLKWQALTLSGGPLFYKWVDEYYQRNDQGEWMQLILTSEDKADFKPYCAGWLTEDTAEEEVSGKQLTVPSLHKTGTTRYRRAGEPPWLRWIRKRMKSQKGYLEAEILEKEGQEHLLPLPLHQPQGQPQECLKTSLAKWL